MLPPTRCGHRALGSVAFGLAVAVAVALLARWRSRRIDEAEAALGIGPHRGAGFG